MFAEYYDENMNLIDTSDLITTNIFIPSVPFENRWVGGQYGIPPIFAGSDYQQKVIEATIELVAQDYYDYNHLRNKLYNIFGFNKPFYIVDLREKGKRHRVVLESDFSPIRHNAINGTVTIPFVTEQFPFAESIGTTQDIQINGIEDQYELWDGMGLIPDFESFVYTHETNQFKIYNAGNETIRPFRQDLKITIIDIVDGSAFELTNITNGTTFKIKETVTDTQEIVLDGPVVTSNGLQFLRSTNRKFIELSPGWNEFQISGATSAKVSFDFRFYYS